MDLRRARAEPGGEVMLLGVMAVSARPGITGVQGVGGRPESSILPTPVQWAGNLRPTAESIRTGGCCRPSAMPTTSMPSSTATCTVSSHPAAAPGPWQGLVGEVELVGEDVAELEKPHAQPVAVGWPWIGTDRRGW